MKHTKGPWKIDASFGETEIVSDLACIAKITGLQIDANAQLIAAAPELLEALKLAFEMHKDNLSSHDERLKVMANAISKASGK